MILYLHTKKKYYLQLYLDKCAHGVQNKQMTDYLDRNFLKQLRLGLINVVLKKIDISKGFDPAEIKNSKECMICSICTIGF